MFELPLFPLQSVLFPGTPLLLHIFEERYKRMIGLCVETRQMFGVVLIRSGTEALGPPAEPFEIGCTAQILEVQRLEAGRMNISAIGRERFRVVSLDRKAQPYLVGTVTQHPIHIPDLGGVHQAGKNLQTWVERYLTLLAASGKGQYDLRKLPTDPVLMAYLAASMLPVSLIQKQELLSSSNALELIENTHTHYRREVALLRALLTEQAEEKGTFSIN